MPVPLLTPDTVSMSILTDIFESAYVDARIDEDGDLELQDGYRAYARLEANNGRLWIWTRFRFRDEVGTVERIRFANTINNKLIVVRACVTDSGHLMFDDYVILEGGLPPKTLVKAVRRFFLALRDVTRYDEDDLLT